MLIVPFNPPLLTLWSGGMKISIRWANGTEVPLLLPPIRRIDRSGCCPRITLVVVETLTPLYPREIARCQGVFQFEFSVPLTIYFSCFLSPGRRVCLLSSFLFRSLTRALRVIGFIFHFLAEDAMSSNFSNVFLSHRLYFDSPLRFASSVAVNPTSFFRYRSG